LTENEKCVVGLEHFEIPKQVIKILENDLMRRIEDDTFEVMSRCM
jgi:hypothetical protein